MGREIKTIIIRSCRELVPTRGLYSLTVDEIAARAGISKRTLYRYFRSKEEIIETTIFEFVNEMTVNIRQVLHSEDDPTVIINSLLVNVFSRAQLFLTNQVLSDMRQYYPHLWERINRYRSEKMQETVKILIEKSGKSSNGEVNPKIISTVIIASINSVATPEFIIGNNLTFDETINQLVKVFSRILV